MKPSADHSPLSPHAYWDPAYYRREQDRVFEQSWIFAGFAGHVRRADDFITARAGQQSVVVCNFAGKLRALHNVCSHRHAILKEEACGNGPLRCRYHGWTYDADGIPVGIPANRDNFSFGEQDKLERRLRNFHVEEIGGFVFVRIASDGPPLREYLGPLGETLESLGATFSVPFTDRARDLQCNWKIGVENTLEAYHVGFAHDETLASVIKAQGELRVYGRHSTACHEMLPASMAWWQKALLRAGLSRCDAYPHYHHFFIYPNLCIGLTFGALLSVQTFEPRSPSTTALHYRLLLPRSAEGDDDADPPAFRRVLADYLGQFNENVLDEDAAPVEWCQRGCREMQRPACLGKSESRLWGFLSAVASDTGEQESDTPERVKP